MSEKARLILKWGAIGGISVSTLGLVTYILNISYGSWVNYVGYAILIAVVLTASYEFRDNLNGGYAKFSELFKFAILICLVYALISTAWSVVFMQYFDTDVLTEVLAQSRAQMEEKGIDEATIEQGLEWTETLMKPHFFALTSMLALMFVGTMISLLTSLILRKENYGDEQIVEEIKEEN